MPRTAEHLVDCHRAAATLRSQGRPIWAHTIDFSSVFHNDDLTFTEKRDQIVAILRRSAWFTAEDEWSELHEIVENIADSEDADEFDNWWDELYDRADYDRVWIKTR